jgi:hypothetical protein
MPGRYVRRVRLTLDARHDAGNEPSRQTHFDHRDQCAVLFQNDTCDIPELKLPKEILDLAIVNTKSGHFDPAQFEDRCENALVDLLKKKEAGEKIEPAKAGPAPRVRQGFKQRTVLLQLFRRHIRPTFQPRRSSSKLRTVAWEVRLSLNRISVRTGVVGAIDPIWGERVVPSLVVGLVRLSPRRN